MARLGFLSWSGSVDAGLWRGLRSRVCRWQSLQVESATIDGVVTKTAYGEFGRTAWTETTFARNGMLLVHARSEYGYDVGGRQTWVKTLSGYDGGTPQYAVTANQYDNDGRLIRVYINQENVPDVDGAGRATSFSDDDRFIEYTYDTDGRRVAKIEGFGPGATELRSTYTHYNAAGQVASIILNWDGATPHGSTQPPGSLPANSISPDNLRFDFEYDADGRQTAIHKPKGGVLNKFYDGDGRLVLELGPVNNDGTGPGNGNRQVTWTSYNEDGRRAAESRGVVSGALAPTAIDPMADITVHTRTEWTYGAEWGSMQEQRLYKHTGASAALERREVYGYGDEGELRSVTTFHGTSTDPARRVVYTYDPVTGWLSGVASPEGQARYERDARGRLTRLWTSTGIDTAYRYDALGRIEQVVDRGLATAGNEAGAVRFQYDPLGRKVAVERPNDSRTEYGYDPISGWTSRIAHLGPGNANQLTLEYERDHTGVIKSVIETEGAGGSPSIQTWWYQYDGLKRLIEAKRRAGTAETGTELASYVYTYDRNGNRRSEAIGASVTNYLYSITDLLTGTSVAKVSSLEWDGIGRLVKETNTTSNWVRDYDWSADDRLMGAVQTGSPAWTVSYTYDHLGTRVSRRSSCDCGGCGPRPWLRRHCARR